MMLVSCCDTNGHDCLRIIEKVRNSQGSAAKHQPTVSRRCNIDVLLLLKPKILVQINLFLI